MFIYTFSHYANKVNHSQCNVCSHWCNFLARRDINCKKILPPSRVVNHDTCKCLTIDQPSFTPLMICSQTCNFVRYELFYFKWILLMAWYLQIHVTTILLSKNIRSAQVKLFSNSRTYCVIAWCILAERQIDKMIDYQRDRF